MEIYQNYHCLPAPCLEPSSMLGIQHEICSATLPESWWTSLSNHLFRFFSQLWQTRLRDSQINLLSSPSECSVTWTEEAVLVNWVHTQHSLLPAGCIATAFIHQLHIFFRFGSRNSFTENPSDTCLAHSTAIPYALHKVVFTVYTEATLPDLLSLRTESVVISAWASPVVLTVSSSTWSIWEKDSLEQQEIDAGYFGRHVSENYMWSYNVVDGAYT